MSEPKKSLSDLSREIGEWAQEKGWNDRPRTEGDWAALTHTEISEAFESYRNGEELYWEREDGKPEGAASENVDAIIRILHWFDIHGIDPDMVMEKKMAYNYQRSYRHGNKKA